MEIKLTADWIFLHNSEIYCRDDKPYFKLNDNQFEYYLTELALKTLNVGYECEVLYEDDDEDFENPAYHYSFENIEDIKETCPDLYSEFKKCIESERKWKEEIRNKQNIILIFLDTPKTLHQIHRHLENECYKYEEGYMGSKNSLKSHTKYLIEDLSEKSFIYSTGNKYGKSICL
jgi:hypothetical protein